jgi:hypothetical protein
MRFRGTSSDQIVTGSILMDLKCPAARNTLAMRGGSHFPQHLFVLYFDCRYYSLKAAAGIKI